MRDDNCFLIVIVIAFALITICALLADAFAGARAPVESPAYVETERIYIPTTGGHFQNYRCLEWIFTNGKRSCKDGQWELITKSQAWLIANEYVCIPKRRIIELK